MRGTIALGALLLAVLAVAGCAVPVTTVPEPPHHTAVEVAVPHGDVVLAGTLTLPGGPGPHPAAVLVTGRGPHDRDETLGPHRPFRLLADTLARAGVAVLRTDDRGVGGSTGSLAGATYDDLVGDTLAAVALLRSRPDVDPERVGLIGHSEGGWLAPLAAVRGPVAFVVSIAGPAVPGTDVLVEQSRLLPGLPGVGADPARFPAFVAAFAARLRGDFVECGVNWGFLSSAIMHYLDWDRHGKTFYLFDTFAGLDPKIVSETERRQGAMEQSRRHLASGHYAADVD
ncbi:MAG: alpha/beta hydrolase, partial [Pseudonocardiales bacterium]|nr:alpha/beta hydrolase [Pseudonocardiales bacterium]